MNSLIGLIEKHDPGHFGRRESSLDRLSKCVRDLGFFPLQITRREIECYWIRVEGKEEGKEVPITWEDYEDAIRNEKTMEILKGFCRYEER